MKLSEQLGLTDAEFEAKKIAIRQQWEREQRQKELIKRDKLMVGIVGPEPQPKASKSLGELQRQIEALEARLMKEQAIQSEKLNNINEYLTRRNITKKNKQADVGW